MPQKDSKSLASELRQALGHVFAADFPCFVNHMYFHVSLGAMSDADLSNRQYTDLYLHDSHFKQSFSCMCFQRWLFRSFQLAAAALRRQPIIKPSIL